MNPSGNYSSFAGAFPNGLLPQVFRMLLDEWSNFEKPDKPLENRITNRLVGHLNNVCRKFCNDRMALPFRFKYREKIPDAGSDSESGEIDIVVDSLSPCPESYFAFECKRLNKTFPSGFKSLAADYVGPGGMCCFMTGQYPCTCGAGGMIGYVMNGDVDSAKSAIDKCLANGLVELRLQDPTRLRPAAILPENPSACQTVHSLNGEPLVIYHLFVAY